MGLEDSRCELSDRQCIPCKGGVEPLRGAALLAFHRRIDPAWTLQDQHHLERQFKLRNFQQALELTNHIGRLAEAQGHHPEITLTWGRVTVRLWTHKINGLHENDFILAAQIDRLPVETL